MIGKLLNLPYQKIAKTVHGEMDQNKRRSSQKKSEQDENEDSQNSNSEVSQEELITWVNELNCLDCYVKNHLNFTLSFEGQHYLVGLVDKNGHTLQEYLPQQFKALYSQLKNDKADSQKGTILNITC